jgi:uncharacterized protein with von Willebrand factor type A (vWA) domain
VPENGTIHRPKNVGEELVGVLTRFGVALRDEGLAIGAGDFMTFCAAMEPLDPTDLVDLYWGGRTCLVTKRDDIPIYHETFRRFFLSGNNPIADMLMVKAHPDAPREESVVPIVVPSTEPGKEEEPEEDETILGLMASNVATLKHKNFIACTPEELEAVRRIMARLRLTPPKRRTRRTRGASSGRVPDLRRTIGKAMRTQGEMIDLSWRKRKTRLRPLILILDISGSMADYSRSLLQFAWSARKAAQKVEVFAFGTRLTHITKALQVRKIDDALERASKHVVDWEGGTRIGDALDLFVRHWGRRGMARGAIVVICSDGLDRGDPEILSTAMERLARLAHTVVWMNPHKGDSADYRAQTLGMMVAEPHIDVMLSCHDFSSLEEFAALLPTLA